jgi:formylglycine-generating enzyme required for sulfatase activity
MKYIAFTIFVASFIIVLVSVTKNNSSKGLSSNPDNFVFAQGGSFTIGCTPEQGSDCMEEEIPIHKVTVGDFYLSEVVRFWETVK